MLHPIAPRPHQSVEERGQIRIAARRVGGVTVFIDPLFFAVNQTTQHRYKEIHRRGAPQGRRERSGQVLPLRTFAPCGGRLCQSLLF